MAGPALVGYALKVEPGRLVVSVREAVLGRLPLALGGITVAHLSDLHVGAYVSAQQVAQAVDLANSLEPDLVALTGDFVYRDASRIDECSRELDRLRPRVATVAVLGNHDVWTQPDAIARSLSAAGITVLRDETLALELEGGRMWLVGLDDRGYSGWARSSRKEFGWHWSSAVRKAGELLGPLPEEEPRLLLVHNPDVTEELPAGGVDLALCGHTHGGQVSLPLIGPPIVPSLYGQRFAEGVAQGTSTLVHVTRGVGLTPPPVRLNCPPEVALVRLRTPP